MYRIRVALIAGLAVAAVTVAAYFQVTGAAVERTTHRVERDVVRAQKELLRASRLEGFDLANQAATFAREDEFVQLFSKSPNGEREKAAFVAVEVRKARMEKPAEARDEAPAKLGILGVVDADGNLLARDLQPNWRLHDNLKKDFPSLGVALGGQANKDIWNLDGSMYRVGAAPIRGAQGAVLGAVFLGYVQSTRDAAAERDVLGTEVAFFLDGKIQASSFQRQGESSSSETAEEKALAAQLFDGDRPASVVTEQRQATGVFKVKIGTEQWLAAAAPLPGNATPSKAGFVVLASLTAARAEGTGGNFILLLGVIGVLVAVGASVATARRFLGPLDRVEAGVSEVINGNRDYEFESPSPDYEGLANGLNVMLARLLGRPDPDNDAVPDDDDEDDAPSGESAAG